MKGGTIFRDIKGVYYAMQKDDDVAYQYNLAEAELFNLINPDPASVTVNSTGTIDTNAIYKDHNKIFSMYEGTRDKNKFISLLTKVTEGRRISAEIFAANRHSTTVNDTHIEQFKLRNDALALLGAQTVQVSPQIGTKGMLSVLDARMSANALELRRLRDAPAAALASPAPAAASRAEAVRAEAELDEKMIQSLTERISRDYTGEDMDGIVYDIRMKYTIERENGVAPPRAGFLTLTYIQNTYLGKKGGKTKRSRKSRKGARKSRKGARKSRKHLFYKI